MTEEQIVDKVCEIMDVKYHHYDNHKMKADYFQHYTLESIPKIVVYGATFGYWQFAILEDMTIHTGIDVWNDTLVDVYNRLKEMGEISPEREEMFKDVKNQMEKMELASKFLKDNNCADVINDPNKKINWV